MEAIYEPRGAAREYAPLACNLYRGCVHGCRYCYAPATLRMTRGDFHTSSRVRPGIVDALRKDARRLVSQPGALRQAQDRRAVPYVLLCFTSDPYPPAPWDSSPTREALEILAAHDVPVEVLTKAGTRAGRDFDVLAGMRGAFGTTLLFTRDEDRQEWEPKAAPVGDRVEAIREAQRRGIPTWVSVEPIIAPEQALALIEGYSDIVDEWRVGKLNHHPLAATIDWAAWAPRLLAALQASGRRYLVKDALAAYLPAALKGQTRGGPAACRAIPQADAAQGVLALGG
jgi:DNA repair photolyase